MRRACRGGVAWLLMSLSVAASSSFPDDPRPPAAGLAATDVAARREAAIRLRDSDRPTLLKALPGLIDRLQQEKDGQVRLAVLDAVTALGPDAAPAVPALLQSLRTDSGGPRLEKLHQDYRAALALAAVGKPAVDGLVGLLSVSKENVRAEAAMSLGRIGPDAAAAVSPLAKLLGDKSERVRQEASLALGRIGASPALTRAAADPSAVTRVGALSGLGGLSSPDAKVRETLLRGTEDAAPEVRAAALRSLTRVGTSDELLAPVVRHAVADADERVRLAAVEALVGRRALLAGVAPRLEPLLTSESEGVARDAAFLLGKLGPDGFPRLLNALRRDSARVDLIAGALAQGGRSAVAPLATAAGDADPRVRRGATLALGLVRPLAPGAVATLSAGLKDPYPGVKAAALTAVGRLGPRAADAAPAVRALLRDPAPAVRTQAVQVLPRVAPRDDRQLADLVPLLDDPDAGVQRGAVDALRDLGPAGRGALPKVVGKLGPDAAPEVRLAALGFLTSHGSAAAEAVPAVAALLDSPSPDVRIAAARTLGATGRAARPALDRLVGLLKDERVEVREAATVTVGGLGLEAEMIRPGISRAIADESPVVRRAALSAVFRLGAEGALFIPDLILLAGREGSTSQARRQLRRFERNGPGAVPTAPLVEQLGHPTPAVRALASRFLGLAGARARDAAPALERLRDDPDAEVRKEAAAALELVRKAAPGSN